MTIKLNLPSPRSVQAAVHPETENQAGSWLSPNGDHVFRLLTADGKPFAQLGEAQGITLFPAAFGAYVASGKDCVTLRDIPASLLNDVSAALRSAGWYVRIRSYPDLSTTCVIAVPYTTVAYFSEPYLIWSGKPFPLTLEEKVWRWLKSWFV
jgi:hypothetical protein